MSFLHFQTVLSDFCFAGFFHFYCQSSWICLNDNWTHIKYSTLKIAETAISIIFNFSSANNVKSGRSLTSRSLMPLSASGIVVFALVSGHTGHTLSIDSDNFDMNGVLYKLIILLNEPQFSLLCANWVVRKFSAGNSTALCNNLEHLCFTW